MANVKAIPEGYHSITSYLNLDGAAKAIDFYKKVFGAEDRGPQMKLPDGKIAHAELKIGDSLLMVSDAMRDPPIRGGLHLYVNDVDAVWKRAVDAGAKILSPLENQFWGDRFGRLQDPFGVTWALATHVEDVPPAEMEKRAREAAAKMAQKS